MTGTRLRRTTVVAGVVGTLLALVAPVHGGVEENKSYTLAVTDVAAGDADAQLTVTLTNTSSNQDLGSANVTVPSPLAVLAAPADADPTTTQVLELRDLAIEPGATVEVPVSVDVRRCTPGTSEPFAVEAKQSNTFRGTGNDFFLDEDSSDLTAGILGTCSLAFAAQPGDAEQGAAVTSVDFDPLGVPITVEVLDASTTPAVATSSTAVVGLTARNTDVAEGPIAVGGTASATAVAGVATFDPGPTLDTSAFDYTLVASADLDGDGSADATATSATFDVVDDAIACRADQPCDRTAVATRAGQRVTATLGSGPTDVTLVVSLGAADVPDFACEGVSTARLAAQYFTLGEGGDQRLGQVTYEIPGASPPLKSYEICWAAPYPFATDGGGTATEQGTKPDASGPLNVGVLPDCARRGEPVRPCVSDRALDRRTSVLTVTIEADGRDPWIRG